MLIWRSPSNSLIQMAGHIPDFREPVAVYDWDNCFNCGGMFFIQTEGVDFGFLLTRCQVCAGTGEALVGIPGLTYSEWLYQDIYHVALYGVTDGQINLQFPQATI